MNSSSESVNANSAPAKTAGAMSGNTTCRRRAKVFAPRSAAARSSERSKPWSLAATIRSTNGVV
jgi:stage V sporulation protein SpoVS